MSRVAGVTCRRSRSRSSGPAGRLVELVQGHVRAERAGDLVEALVARPGDDGVVARSEQDVHQAEDRLLGAGERQDLVRLDRLVERGDLAPQERVAGRLRVAELEAVPQRSGLVVGEGEELGHRVGLHVRGAQQVPGGELPAGEVALQREVGDAHRPMMRHHRAVDPAIVVVGVPTALGGHLPGMELAPSGLRALGLLDRLRARPRLAGADLRDAGDLAIDPGFRLDPDPRAGNRAAICEFLPRERDLVASALRSAGRAIPDARLLILGGDCTAHAGALAGLRAARPGSRLAIAWFDAHGDFNTPDSTPSGHVFGMPFAMICGRGDADLVAAADGPTVDEGDAALFGGQVLDEAESRSLAASKIAHFGAGMLSTEAGQAAVGGWANAIAARVDGLYVAFDMDCLDAAGGWAVAMPESGGMAIETALATVRRLAAAIPVVGFGATAISLDNGDADATADAIAALAEAALRPTAADQTRLAGRAAGPGSAPDDDQVRGDRPRGRLVETGHDEDPARRRLAIDRDRPAPVVEGDERPLTVAERGRSDIHAGRDAATLDRAERSLVERDLRAVRTPVHDMQLSPAGEAILAFLDVPAIGQDRAVDRPIDRRGHGREEVAILGTAAACRGAAAAGRR